LSRITQTTESIEPSALAEAIAAIRNAELVVYPTETFYGLAADPYSDVALNRLFAVKGREAAKAVALIAADTASAFAIAREVPKAALVLAEAFWPGPLTLVLPARDGFGPSLLGPDGGIVGTSDYRNQRQSVGRTARGYCGASQERTRRTRQSVSRG
jgi:L-threonylcarbamoyladenylate synthase